MLPKDSLDIPFESELLTPGINTINTVANPNRIGAVTAIAQRRV